MTTMIRSLGLGIASLMLTAIAWAEPTDKAKEELPAQQRWSEKGPGGVPGFTRHIQPLLAKSGCSGRACHG